MARYSKQEYKKVKKLRFKRKFWNFIRRYAYRTWEYCDRRYEHGRHELLSISRRKH
jgi:hypothetical protein